MQSQPQSTTYSSEVFHGDQTGRQLNFPTINLDPKTVPANTEPGVYASKVIVKKTNYMGALYLGPRFIKGETHNVLEIYLLDFNEEIYGEVVTFTLEKFIRPVIDFTSLEAFKAQLREDIAAVRDTLTRS